VTWTASAWWNCSQPVMVPPVAPPVVAPTDRVNNLALASLVCGLAQFAVGPLGTLPAIILGHMARGQIKRTGERGAGLALAGLLLGWGAVVLGIFIAVMAVAVIANHPMVPPSQFPQQFPQP